MRRALIAILLVLLLAGCQTPSQFHDGDEDKAISVVQAVATDTGAPIALFPDITNKGVPMDVRRNAGCKLLESMRVNGSFNGDIERMRMAITVMLGKH